MYRDLLQSAALVAAFCFPLYAMARSYLRRNATRAPSVAMEVVSMAMLSYLIALAAITVAPLRMASHPGAATINLVPLKAFACLFAESTVPEAAQFCLQNVLGNIALFVPFGVLIPFVWLRARRVDMLLLGACLLSLSIELTQLAERGIGVFRAADVDDVLLNLLGAAVGYLLFRIIVHRPLTFSSKTS